MSQDNTSDISDEEYMPIVLSSDTEPELDIDDTFNVELDVSMLHTVRNNLSETILKD
jgi:hypothetical protein